MSEWEKFLEFRRLLLVLVGHGRTWVREMKYMQPAGMIGSLTRHIKEWVHDRLAHTNIKEGVNRNRRGKGRAVCVVDQSGTSGSMIGSLSHTSSARVGPEWVHEGSLSHTSSARVRLEWD